jgi:DNA-binding transcriptional ArsR family regulator
LPSSGNELARALNLSNYEIGEHTAILRKARMVRVEKMNQMLNFSLDKEAVRREVGKALEDLLKDVKSYYRSSSFR